MSISVQVEGSVVLDNFDWRNNTWNNSYWSGFIFLEVTYMYQYNCGSSSSKAIIHFRHRKKKKVQKFTNTLQGLQKVMVKDFSWNIIPWNALLFEKTVKQYQFSIARITDLF